MKGRHYKTKNTTLNHSISSKPETYIRSKIIIDSFIHLFPQQILIKCLICVTHHAKYLRYDTVKHLVLALKELMI